MERFLIVLLSAPFAQLDRTDTLMFTRIAIECEPKGIRQGARVGLLPI